MIIILFTSLLLMMKLISSYLEGTFSFALGGERKIESMHLAE